MYTKNLQPWLDLISDEDLVFIKRFILASGSLKALASDYEVTYPTIRLRVDRLINKIKLVDELPQADAFEHLLRAEFSEGRIESSAFKKLLSNYQVNKQSKTKED